MRFHFKSDEILALSTFIAVLDQHPLGGLILAILWLVGPRERRDDKSFETEAAARGQLAAPPQPNQANGKARKSRRRRHRITSGEK